MDFKRVVTTRFNDCLTLLMGKGSMNLLSMAFEEVPSQPFLSSYFSMLYKDSLSLSSDRTFLILSDASAEMFVGEKWAECTECDIWYHTDSCLNVTDELLKGDWECPGCLYILPCNFSFSILYSNEF